MYNTVMKAQWQGLPTKQREMITTKDLKFSLKNPKYFNCILFIVLNSINGIEPIS